MGIKRMFSKVCKIMSLTQLDIKIIKKDTTLANEINKAVITLMTILKANPLTRAAIPLDHIPVGIVGAGPLPIYYQNRQMEKRSLQTYSEQ